MTPQTDSMLRRLLQALEGEGSRFTQGPEPGTWLMTAHEDRPVNPPAVWRATDEDTDALVQQLVAEGGDGRSGGLDEPSAPRAGLASLIREVSDRLASVGPAGAMVEITADHVSVVGRDQPEMPPGDYRWVADRPD